MYNSLDIYILICICSLNYWIKKNKKLVESKANSSAPINLDSNLIKNYKGFEKAKVKKK